LERGAQFHPDLVDAFIFRLDEVLQIRETHSPEDAGGSDGANS
jgi:hypothetical protein